jgi:AcrR family transcriptional regulator
MDSVLEAAWAMAREDGLAAVSLHEVARRIGIRQPSLYAYVDSKAGLYDAMFAQAAAEMLRDVSTGPYPSSPRDAVVELSRRIVDFATADPARYQLLFLRTVPGFEPRPDSYALSVQLWDWLVERLQAAGMDDPADVDVYTALIAGLVVQQTSNDPGGDRWTRHLDTVLSIFFAHLDRGTVREPIRRQEGQP